MKNIFKISLLTIAISSSAIAMDNSSLDQLTSNLKDNPKISKDVLSQTEQLKQSDSIIYIYVKVNSNHEGDQQAAENILSSISSPNFDVRIDKSGQGFYITTTIAGITEISKHTDTVAIESAISNGYSRKSDDLVTWAMQGTQQSISHAIVSQQQYTGKGIKIAVLDTGVNNEHIQLKNKIIKEYCFQEATTATAAQKARFPDLGDCPNGSKFQEGKGAAFDDNGHGSHVTGIIAAQPTSTSKVVGGATGAEIISMKVLNASANGPNLNVINALQKLATDPDLQDVKVINMSLGINWSHPGDCDNFEKHDYTDVINTLVSQGKVIVVASGNDRLSNGEGYPSCLSQVISVAAHPSSSASTPYGFRGYKCSHHNGLKADKIACFSNIGPSTDIVGPGVEVTSLGMRSPNDTFIESGTSMAAPAVAACIAKMFEKNSILTPSEVKLYLQHGGHYITKVNDNDHYITKMDCDATLAKVPLRQRS